MPDEKRDEYSKQFCLDECRLLKHLLGEQVKQKKFVVNFACFQQFKTMFEYICESVYESALGGLNHHEEAELAQNVSWVKSISRLSSCFD